jgi:hypothetical protein
MTQIGTIRHITRYPVKSMRGESLNEANIGFQGIPGDRAYTFVQDGLVNLFPFLTGRECPDLMRYQPEWEIDATAPRSRPSLMVRTPEGQRLPIESEELRADLERRAGRAVRLHSDYRGNHDVAYISVIGWPTIRALAEAAGVEPDQRRWRMTLVLDADIEPFGERAWLGRFLAMGDVRLAVTAGQALRHGHPRPGDRAVPGGAEEDGGDERCIRGGLRLSGGGRQGQRRRRGPAARPGLRSQGDDVRLAEAPGARVGKSNAPSPGHAP